MSDKPSHVYVREWQKTPYGPVEKNRYAHVLKWDGPYPIVHTADHLQLMVLEGRQWWKP